MRLQFKKTDLVAVAAVIAAAVLLLVLLPGKESGTNVSIYRDGQLVKELSLFSDVSFEVEGEYTNVVTIENGKVFVSRSDCPGEDCVRQGAVSSGSIICLPNRVEIRVSGSGPDTSTN